MRAPREYRYSSITSFTSALNGTGCLTPRPGRFTPGKKHVIHYIEGWLGLRTGLDECRKSSSPHRFRSQDRPASSQSLHRLIYPSPLFLPRFCAEDGSVYDSASERKEFQGREGKGGRCVGLITLAPSFAVYLKVLGSSNSWGPRGLFGPVEGCITLLLWRYGEDWSKLRY